LRIINLYNTEDKGQNSTLANVDALILV